MIQYGINHVNLPNKLTHNKNKTAITIAWFSIDHLTLDIFSIIPLQLVLKVVKIIDLN